MGFFSVRWSRGALVPDEAKNELYIGSGRHGRFSGRSRRSDEP